jgi:2-methylaconitate cis-trans-isomerase PrpF
MCGAAAHRILINFADTAGDTTGRLLPTGRPVVEVPGFGRSRSRWSISAMRMSS